MSGNNRRGARLFKMPQSPSSQHNQAALNKMNQDIRYSLFGAQETNVKDKDIPSSTKKSRSLSQHYKDNQIGAAALTSIYGDNAMKQSNYGCLRRNRNQSGNQRLKMMERFQKKCDDDSSEDNGTESDEESGVKK